VSLKNWTQFKWPYEPMETFTKSEPFPKDEMKATYVGTHPRRKSAKVLYRALLARKKKGAA
jgi:hypothetical protein